jgi:hypothetical protein
MTEEENDKRLKDSLRLIDEYFEKNKKPTLQELFEDYFLKQAFNDVLSKDLSYQLIWIVRDFLPKEHDSNSYDWNRCIKTIRENLE